MDIDVNASFPTDVLKWMKLNAKPKLALKLMQICKFFQHKKFPYFIVKNLHGDFHGWEYRTLFDRKFQRIDLKLFSNKLWIIGDLNILAPKDQINFLMPKISVCDIKELHMIDQNITFEQFKILTSEGNIEIIGLNKSFIRSYSNGETVPLENLFDCLPNIKSFGIFFIANSFISSENATKKVPSKLKEFRFCQIWANFDVEECVKFVQNNQQIYFILELSYSRSVELLQAFTDNLIKTWSSNYKPPFISFEGQTSESQKALEKLADIYRQQHNQ